MRALIQVIRYAVKWARGLAFLSGLLSSSALAYAQGCAMCYTSAAAAKAGAVQALRSGILILLVPPLVMFAGIFVVIYRSRDRFSGSPDWSAELDREWREMLAQMDSFERPDLPEGSLSSVVRSPLSVASRPRTTNDGPLTTDH